MGNHSVSAPSFKSRLKAFFDQLDQSEMPLAVYAAVLAGMAASWIFSAYHPDLSLNIFSELLGAAFTLFIIDTLLVRSKTKRWKMVHEHVDYLIARDVNRIRDGIATRAFYFSADLQPGMTEQEQIDATRKQRDSLLTDLEALPSEELEHKINEKELFIDNNLTYFKEKAEDIWDLLNMKYSEYLAPDLVSCLMQMHTNLKDLCGHIRQYRKAERFPKDSVYYRMIGIKGAGVSLKEIIMTVNRLKEKGYSKTAILSEGRDHDERLFRR